MEMEQTAAAVFEGLNSADMEDRRSQDVKTLFVAVTVVRDN
jgi:hypothetical protein